MNTRPYLVVAKNESDPKKVRIVEASNPSQATRHVAKDTLVTRPLTASEVIYYMTQHDVKPERAKRDQDTGDLGLIEVSE